MVFPFIEDAMRRVTAAPVFWSSAFCDTFRHVALAGLCLSILWLILSDFVRFLLGSWPCVSRWKIQGACKFRLENRVQNQKIMIKSVKNDRWERLGKDLEKGALQDPQMWGAPMLFWTLLAPLGRLWAPLWVHLAPNGGPRVPKWSPK